MPEETITISTKLYRELLKDQAKLKALEDAGVDNWDWYGEAIASLNDDPAG